MLALASSNASELQQEESTAMLLSTADVTNTTCSIHEVQKLKILFRTLLLLQQCLACYSKIQNKICASGQVPE